LRGENTTSDDGSFTAIQRSPAAETLAGEIVLNHVRQSLRSRLLWPLVFVSISASIVVAIGSYWFASRNAERELANRYRSIAAILENGSFPLTRNVLDTIATLAETDFITARFDGTVLESTLDAGDPGQLFTIVNRSRLDRDDVGLAQITHGKRRYRVGTFRRTSIASGSQSVAWVVVLFDEARLRSSLVQAVAAPLVTGLSTIALLTTITLTLTSRLIRRISHLEEQVQRIANGEFETTVVSGPSDEVGLLASAVSSMAGQLQRMWQTIHQREGERLLHQVAAGLAHNLRNSLTGARMAIELHGKKCNQRDDEGLRIALHEIEQTESYVQRLLFVAAGKQDVDKPARVVDCFDDLKSSLNSIASHTGVKLTWHLDTSIHDAKVVDGPTLVAAITNLVFNAMHASSNVVINANLVGDGHLAVEVMDDGPGPSLEIQETLFDPFVTTKPEGQGLGLPLVRRASRRLGGDVHWLRKDFRTIFTLTAKIL
jgi:signal transduction histidine kinase